MKMNLKETYLDFDNPEDWSELEKIGIKAKGDSFRNLTEKAHFAGGWEYLTKDGYPYVEDVIFVEDNGKKVGFAMVADQHSTYEGVDALKNTLNVLNIVVLPEYEKKGVGTKLLQYVFDYGKENDYECVEFICKINPQKFSKSKNEYIKNGLKSVKVYEDVKKSGNAKNIYFRTDVNCDIRNFSSAMFKSFKTYLKKDLTALDEQILEKEISKQYIDIVKSNKKLSKEEINQIKTNPLFKDLSITLADVLKNKDTINPVEKTQQNLKLSKMLKGISSIFKPKTDIAGDISRVQHVEKVDRILCGVKDEMLNEENIKRIKNNETFGSLKRL